MGEPYSGDEGSYVGMLGHQRKERVTCNLTLLSLRSADHR